jgi:hypothetical protein
MNGCRTALAVLPKNAPIKNKPGDHVWDTIARLDWQTETFGTRR